MSRQLSPCSLVPHHITERCHRAAEKLRLGTSRPTRTVPIHHFPHTNETADRDYPCARDELYGTLREREADPIHIFVATEEDMAALKFGPCPYDGIIKTGARMARFDLPLRGDVHFHPDCIPPHLQPDP